MSTKPLAALALSILVVSASLFVPQRASAQGVGIVNCSGGLFGLSGLFGAIPAGVPIINASISGSTLATAGTTGGSCVYELIIKPLARQLIHQILVAFTASVINWINGNNGTGQPSFVANLSLHLQAVGDSVALPFITQVQRGLNPAFAGTIASSLLVRYAQGTSVGGFFASNQSTLPASSPTYQPDFLNGRWEHGGTSAWLALATQNENNPYVLYPAANAQLGTLVNQAQTNRRQDLVQGRGFLSWCGPSNQGGGASGVNPTASCINSDGTSGNVQTPGTVIQGYLSDTLGSDIAQLTNASDIDSSIAAIFGAALNQTFRTVLGGTGLFGASITSSVRPQAITTALRTSASSNSSSINAANAAAARALSNVSLYTAAWSAIATAANTAQTDVTTLKNTCTSQADSATAALATIQSVLVQAQLAVNEVSDTQALALQVQQDAQDTTSAGAARLAADMQALASAPPSAADITSAQSNAATTGGATANPTGSLTVSGGTTVDQMHLIDQNATALLIDPVACPAP